jgi:hypothetical protein
MNFANDDYRIKDRDQTKEKHDSQPIAQQPSFASEINRSEV